MIDYRKAESRLRNGWPLVGKFIRRRACTRLAADGSAAAVPLLVEALGDRDEQVRASADAALRGLTARDAVDALCDIAIQAPTQAAARICSEARKRPSDPEKACLLLFVTRQLEEYFREDFEFQNLRAAYDRAGDEVRAHVMEVVRSGDRRCLGFFGRRKRLVECNDEEIRLAVDSGLRHRDWPRLFQAFQEMPLRYGFPLLEEFRKSGWEPEQEDQRALFRAVLSESAGQALPKAEETSSLFDRWLAEGRSGELSRLPAADLQQRLGAAAPPEGVKLAAALAGKAQPGSPAARAVQRHAHWLVRLAGYAAGLCQADLRQDSVPDDNYWVRELVRDSVLDFWPARATPADLDQLNAAPREAFTGRYGAVRRVLRLLLAYRVTAPEIAEVVVEGGEFAGEFTEA
jgi:hypothetical protein